MTERLYYNDSYIHEFSANVLEQLTVSERPAVVLDHTYFYPTSGGQPNDTGEIEGVSVVDVFTREGDSAVVHVLSAPLQVNSVTCRVDWSRRFDFMQHHTGQHILSQAFVQVADAHTVGFHLSPDSVTIDLNKTGLADATVAKVEDLANSVLYENRAVTARIVDPSNTAGVRMRNLPEHLHTAGVRVIDIENFDVTACGGTHVTRTGEIGIIKVLRLEKRGDKTRVEFRCGKRALLDYRLKNALIYQLTAAFTCGMEELPQSVQRLQDNLKSLQSDLKSASQQLLDYEASRLLAEATEHNGIRIVKLVFEQRDAGEIRLLASRLAQSPGTIALMGTSGERANLVFARATDLPDDMNALLKQTLAQIENGRGGGQLTMAQGSGNATTQELQVALDEATKTIEANHST